MSLGKKKIIFFATGFYTGYAPIAPGTIGTLLGIPIGFLFSRFSIINQLLFFSISFFIFSKIAGMAEEYLGKKDAGQIVCDEAVGFVISMFLIPYTIFNIIIVFFLFRFFDILKPFPIRMIDQRLKNGYGVVLDDVLAGVYANIVFHIFSNLKV
ncbi:MAG: phosphatidylglycerophosphatase A [Deltaproteobacteria bacterium]|nr:phosphatidylglycerophosphatase A [Deltaproteobacteria bacterium]